MKKQFLEDSSLAEHLHRNAKKRKLCKLIKEHKLSIVISMITNNLLKFRFSNSTYWLYVVYTYMYLFILKKGLQFELWNVHLEGKKKGLLFNLFQDYY